MCIIAIVGTRGCREGARVSTRGDHSSASVQSYRAVRSHLLDTPVTISVTVRPRDRGLTILKFRPGKLRESTTTFRPI